MSVVLPEPGEMWEPDLNNSQRIAWNSSARYNLLHGEKGSGKGIGALHAGVRHCYENNDALFLIISQSVRTGKFGLMRDLIKIVLPAWRDGNRYPPMTPDMKPHPLAGKLMDEGIGLEYSDPRIDPSSKDTIIDIVNMNGNKCQIVMFSIPYDGVIEERIRALSPSFVMVDELDVCNEDYLDMVAIQLGRRSGIDGPQQYYGVCNPRGKTHWIYRRWWEQNVLEDGKTTDPDYCQIHVPVTENLHRLPPGYVDGLKKILKHPIIRRRLIGGEWVDMPAGDAIFRDVFLRELHVRGSVVDGTGEIPIEGFSLIVGLDPGPKNFSAHIMQCIPTTDGNVWKIIDELNYVGKPTHPRVILRKLKERLELWDDIVGVKLNRTFIADEACDDEELHGDFSARALMRFAKEVGLEMRLRFFNARSGNNKTSGGSVPARVQMMIDLLTEQRMLVSAQCVQTIDMFEALTSQKPKRDEYDAFAGLRPKRSAHIHPFDSMTYPIAYYSMHPLQFASRTGGVMAVYSCGDPTANR